MGRPNFKDPLVNSKLPKHHQMICRRFRKVRLDNGLTQSEYAAKLGIDISGVKHIETGIFLPSLDTLKAMKKRFGISYNYLIEGK